MLVSFVFNGKTKSIIAKHAARSQHNSLRKRTSINKKVLHQYSTEHACDHEQCSHKLTKADFQTGRQCKSQLAEFITNASHRSIK